jgi:hypothetical protein
MVKQSRALIVTKFVINVSADVGKRRNVWESTGSDAEGKHAKVQPYFQHIQLQIKVVAANQIWSFSSHKNKQLLCHSRASLSGGVVGG